MRVTRWGSFREEEQNRVLAWLCLKIVCKVAWLEGGGKGRGVASMACTRMRRSVRCTVGRMSMRTPIHGISLSFSDSLWFRQQV